jgi:hypothetical protein
VVDAAIPTAINVIQRLIRDILVSKISVELTI